MSHFGDFNSENKLRIPLSAFASHIIESDCFSFSKKKTTLINLIILNSYQTANCSISLRIKDLKNDLLDYSHKAKSKDRELIIDSIIKGKEKELISKYAKRYSSDYNWQITLSKRVKELLTEDSYTAEELYYGQKPGHYIRAIIEEYSRLPYYMREEIIFKQILDASNIAIEGNYLINITNTRGTNVIIKPYAIKTDPLSMFHYLIGYIDKNTELSGNELISYPEVISLRISRITNAEIQYISSGKLSNKEIVTIENEINKKGVQFITSEEKTISILLTDSGIKRYESQAHLRPQLMQIDSQNDHLYHFECTETQILYYFFEFGNDAKIISPLSLADTFRSKYKQAYDSYQ